MRSFIFDQQAGETPETIAQKRKIADALASQAVSTAPMQSWTQGLAQVVAALGSKYQSSKANSAETAGREGASSKFNDIVGALYGGNKPAASEPASFGPVDGSKGAQVASMLQKDFGLSPAAAAGFAGNLAHESGNFKTLQEINPTVPGSKGGYGWGQWTGPRRRAFEQYVAQNKLDPTSDEANYGFLKHELTNTPEGAVLARLKGVNDPAQAAQIVAQYYERPGVPHMSSRINYAQQIAGQGGAQNMPFIPGQAGGQRETMPNVPGQRPVDVQQMAGGATVQPAGYSPGAAQQGGQLPMAEILKAMSDPYTTEAQQGILAQIVKQKMATGEWTKLNDGTMFNNLTGETHAVDVPRAPMTVGPGASVYNPNTGEAEFTSPAAPKSLRTEIKDIGGRSVLVNMDTGETIKDLGASPVKQKDYPAGYEASPDGNGMRRIPGYRDSNLEMDMRKEFDGLTKDFRQVRDSYNRIQASSEDPTPAGDLSLIFNYMKMLDPGSVVRESEFAVAANAAPLLTRYGLDPEKLKGVWQGQKLTPEQRADFLSRAESLYGEQDQTFQTLADQYTATAARNGLDPANIILTPRANPRKKRKAAPVTINGYQIIEEQ